MTLLTAVFAAIVTTILWYKTAPTGTMRLGTLCLMYWGALLMWFVDAIFEYLPPRVQNTLVFNYAGIAPEQIETVLHGLQDIFREDLAAVHRQATGA